MGKSKCDTLGKTMKGREHWKKKSKKKNKKKKSSRSTRSEVVKEAATAGSGYSSVCSVLMGTRLESVVVKVCGKKKRNMN